jgi:hypothetical protein
MEIEVNHFPTDLDSEDAQESLSIPERFRHLLPKHQLTVKDFLKFNIPKAVKTFHLASTARYFSHDEANADLHGLEAKPVPPIHFVEKMLRAFNSTPKSDPPPKSVINERESHIRYPVWILEYWREAHFVIDTWKMWQTALKWLEGHESESTLMKDSRSRARAYQLQNGKAVLLALPWNGPLDILGSAPNDTRTWKFARILSDMWISDDIIDMYMTHLSSILEASGSELSPVQTMIANLSLSRSIQKNGGKSSKYLDKLKDRLLSPIPIKRSKAKKAAKNIDEDQDNFVNMRWLFFPHFVKSGHWISFRIDLKMHEISYGTKFKLQMARCSPSSV